VPVPFLGFCRIGVVFLQVGNVRALLEIHRINTGGGGEQEPRRRVDPGRLQHVDVDHGAVAGDVGVESGDVADATHVRRQVVHLVDFPGGDQAVVETAEVQELELVARAHLVLRVLDVDAPHPVALIHQVLHQMVPDKASGTRH